MNLAEPSQYTDSGPDFVRISINLSPISSPAPTEAKTRSRLAAASIDLKHDEADLRKKIACPLLTLWGERSPMGRLYDVLAMRAEAVARASVVEVAVGPFGLTAGV